MKLPQKHHKWPFNLQTESILLKSAAKTRSQEFALPLFLPYKSKEAMVNSSVFHKLHAQL